MCQYTYTNDLVDVIYMKSNHSYEYVRIYTCIFVYSLRRARRQNNNKYTILCGGAEPSLRYSDSGLAGF